MPLFKGTAAKAKPKKAIDYVTDPNKAVIVSSLSMDDSTDYAKQFKETCDMYGKGNGYNERKYYHFKLSPDRADNATLQQCHELAERMAKKLFSAYECVIATHTDTDTVHSHIIINAVSFETGNKFHMNLWRYRDAKDLADTLGEEMGFTKMDWRTKTAEKLDRIFADEAITTDKKYISHAEKQIAKRDKTGNASWKEALRQAIDEAKAYCINRAEFQQYLQNTFDITMSRNTAKAVSFIHPAVGETNAIRGNKLGSDYTADSIDAALQINYERGTQNARLWTTEEQPGTTATAAITNAAANGAATSPERYGEVEYRERLTPRSVSDISAELRSLDKEVGRIANRVSASDESGDSGTATKPSNNEQHHEAAVGRNAGHDNPDRPEPSERNNPTKPVHAKPPEPDNEHERIVQQRNKRRSSDRGR